MGWHDLASSRLESNLDVQAATATARGGEVDLFLASPSQHYGWEALDVVLNLAARRDPPSVMSLTFGGMEQPRVFENDRPDETYQTEMGRGGGGDDFGGSATATNDDFAAERARNRGGPVARLGAESPGANASVSEALPKSSTSERVSAGVSSARVPKPSASARGLEDANKPRPSYVKEVDAWNLLERVDTELAKLGLRGVTVVAASGDNGPFSFGIPNPYQAWSSPDTPCSFQPSFPGSMPHVVAVGGTTGGKDPFKPERAAAVESGGKITSGGGFSNVFPQPEWQKLAVQRYLKQYSYDLPPESFFNQSNRAYPDVAFAAEDIAVVFADIRRDDDDAAEEAEAASRASEVRGSAEKARSTDWTCPPRRTMPSLDARGITSPRAPARPTPRRCSRG
jgi:tripeptidyl-peptidase-1